VRGRERRGGDGRRGKERRWGEGKGMIGGGDDSWSLGGNDAPELV